MFDTYWQFASERQSIFHRRVAGDAPPWTDDHILSDFRFTNAYRAADRVSQYLITNVIYKGDQQPREVLFRVMLFKLFNRVSTWEALVQQLGWPTASEFNLESYDTVLNDAFERGDRLYSAAYIMPAAFPRIRRKHRTHLQLIDLMLTTNLAERIAEVDRMADAYRMIIDYPGIGPFLAYQLATDLNYSNLLGFSEMDFVKAGPGAISGLSKCFLDAADFSAEDLIRWTTDRQEEEFDRRGIEFQDLWGRPLQLIDCQNLFCEVDKYARVAHPEITGSSGRSRIKQRFAPESSVISVWFPPKWNLNHRLPSGHNVDSTA